MRPAGNQAMLCSGRKASRRSQSGDMNYDIGASVKAAAAVANRRNLYLRTTPTGTWGPARRVPRRSGAPPLGGRGEPRGPALFESEA